MNATNTKKNHLNPARRRFRRALAKESAAATFEKVFWAMSLYFIPLPIATWTSVL